jgi:hypothetical protein
MKREEYIKYYQKIDSGKLIEILENQKKYNPIAIEVAQLELERRNLTKDEYSNFKSEIEEKNKSSQEKKESLTQVKNKLNERIDESFETTSKIIDPTIENPKLTNIRILSGFLIFYGLYTLLSQFEYLKFVFNTEEAEISLFEIKILLLIIFPIISGVLIWKPAKIGWFLTITTCMIFIVLSFLTFSIYPTFGGLYIPVLTVIFYGSIIYYLGQENLRSAFNITKQDLINSGIAIVFLIILMNILVILIN